MEADTPGNACAIACGPSISDLFGSDTDTKTCRIRLSEAAEQQLIPCLYPCRHSVPEQIVGCAQSRRRFLCLLDAEHEFAGPEMSVSQQQLRQAACPFI